MCVQIQVDRIRYSRCRATFGSSIKLFVKDIKIKSYEISSLIIFLFYSLMVLVRLKHIIKSSDNNSKIHLLQFIIAHFNFVHHFIKIKKVNLFVNFPLMLSIQNVSQRQKCPFPLFVIK